MPHLALQYGIRTLDNELLFSPGTFLTKETLDAVLNSHKVCPSQTYPLLSHGSVKKDCLNFLSTPPYDVIFQDKDQMNDLLDLLEVSHFSVPILESLDYFKQHDFYTYAHILMVAVLSTLLARDLIPDYQQYMRLSATGPTHDIGKICVPLEVLKKTTPLTETERSLIEHHSAAGYVLLSYYSRDSQNLACQVALEHHERRDASGYPRGIKLRDRLVEIIAVSDIYDALIKPRPYRSSAYDNRAALEEITELAKQNKIGWDLVKSLIAHNRVSRPHYREITISEEKRGTLPSHNFHGIIAQREGTDPKDEIR